MRSVIALLIVSTFAYLALSQQPCVPAPAGCTSCTAIPSLPNQCTQCGSGFLLTGVISGCATACGTGCWTCTNATVCLVCSPGYTLWSTTGVCVMLATGCTMGTATNATAYNCTATWANYTLSSGVPVACGGATASVAGTTTWTPVTNCVACTATATTFKLIATYTPVITGTWVTCTQCAIGYLLVTAIQQACTTAAVGCGMGISTPECILFGATAVATAVLTTAGNQYATAGFAANSLGPNAGCAQGTVTYATGFTTVATVVCTWAASGFWCPTGATLGNTIPTSCQSATAATALYPATVPTNCLGGMATSTAATAAQTTCQWCTNSSFYLSANTAANTCNANNASCITQVSATNCTMAAQGFTLVAGIVTACSNTTTSCTGGLAAGSIMTASGASIVGTAVAGCQYHNMSGVCVQCQMMVTSVQNCTACPSNCVNCTMSSGTTSCSTCNSGFNLWSANGSCLAACANNTNRSTVNGSCIYSKNMIASAVAFASLVFYYIF